MDIKDNIKNRSDLKSYFVKNAIPTESNFSELIESALNQREDGLVKSAGDPLSIEAAGDASSQKKAINFYWDFSEEKAHWALSLNPRSNPSRPETARPGFSISDADGNSRLFVDRGTGSVGIGTVDPKERLDVHGNIKLQSLTIGPWPSNPANYVFFGTNALDQTQQGNYALLQDSAGSGVGRTFLNSPVDIRFRIANADKMILLQNGNVGIGTSSPSAKLEINGFTETVGISVNNGQNTGVGRGVWLWKPGDSNHVIYSASPSGKSPANATAVRGYFDANHRLRFRTPSSQGFLFENSSEQALVDIDATDGRLWTKGSIHCGGDVIGAAKNAAGQAQRIRCGSTSTSAWKVYSSAGVYVDVNTSHAGFTSTPVYVASLAGNSQHWYTTGGSSVYNPTKTGFRVYVRYADGRAFTPANARDLGWHITWVAIGN